MFVKEEDFLKAVDKDIQERNDSLAVIETPYSSITAIYRKRFLQKNIRESREVNIVTGILPQDIFVDPEVVKSLENVLQNNGKVTLIAGPEIVLDKSQYHPVESFCQNNNFEFYYTSDSFGVHFVRTDKEIYFEEPHLNFQPVRKGYVLQGFQDTSKFLKEEISKFKRAYNPIESFGKIPSENLFTKWEYAQKMNEQHFEKFVGQTVDREIARIAWRAHMFYLGVCRKAS